MPSPEDTRMLSKSASHFESSKLKQDLAIYKEQLETTLIHKKWLEGVIKHTEQAIKELEFGQVRSAGSVRTGEFGRMRIYNATLTYLERYSGGEMVPIRAKLLEALKLGGAVTADGRQLADIRAKPGRDSENEQYRSVMTSLVTHAKKGRLRYDEANDTIGLPQSTPAK